MKDDFDRYADDQEYRADMMEDSKRHHHNEYHQGDFAVPDECEYCQEAEEEQENEND